MTTLDPVILPSSGRAARIVLRVPPDQVGRGQPATVTVAAASGSLADLPDAVWLAAFHRTEGSLADLEIQRPEQPVIDPIPFFGF